MKTSLSVLAFLAAACLWWFPSSVRAARAYAVADATTGYILNGENLDERVAVASLTKIATAMVVLDWVEKSGRDLNALVVVPSSALSVGGANPVGFQAGDQVSLRDLLYAALLQSDNVAAQTLAFHVGRQLRPPERERRRDLSPVTLFVAQMNALARKLNMTRTRFLNPTGLDREERPYSTARDMVALTNYAMARSSFRFFVSQKERRILRLLPTGEEAGYLLVNTNSLLGTHAIDGVKTGKTARAGSCLALSSARDPESILNPDGSHTITPRRLVVVLLNVPHRFDEGARLVSSGWKRYDEWAARGRPQEVRKKR